MAQAARPAPAPTPQTVLPLTQQAPAAPLYPPHAYYPPQWQHAQPPVMPAPPLQPSIIPVRPRPPQSAAPAGPEAYAPPPKVFTLPPAAYAPPPPQAVPHSIQRAVAEITARQRALKGDPPQAAPAPDPVAAGGASAARAAVDAAGRPGAGPLGPGRSAAQDHRPDRDPAPPGRRGSDQRAPRRTRRYRPRAQRRRAAARASIRSSGRFRT